MEKLIFAPLEGSFCCGKVQKVPISTIFLYIQESNRMLLLCPMVYADSLDFYEVRRMGALTGEGMETLSRCYLPLIGAEALGVYFALYWDLTCLNESTVETHESFFRRSLVSSGSFERALRALEAIGLIRTFHKKGDGSSSYFIYCVYPPMESSSFLSNPLTSKTLKGVIGEEAYSRLSATVCGASLPEGAEEKTLDFASFYKPEFAGKLALDHGEQGAAKSKIPLSFSSEKLRGEFDSLGIRPDLLSENELRYVAEIATLYELDEATMASFAFDCFQPRKQMGQRLDLSALSKMAEDSLRFKYMRHSRKAKSQVSSETDLAKKIQLMDEASPVAFLTFLQGGRRPPKGDLQLLERLYLEIGLPRPCINALVDFVLQRKQNTLPSTYCEKIAGAMVREGCQTARDAMDYLLSVDRQMKAKPSKYYGKNTQKAPKEAKNEEEVSNEEIASLLNSLYEEEGSSE